MKQQLQGPFLVALMFLVGLGLGGFAWWYQLRSDPLSRAFWRTRDLLLIEQGARVELLQLNASDGDGAHDTLDVHGRSVTVMSSIVRAPGLIHARHALVVDPNFRWQAAVSGCGPNWDFALRFSAEQPATHQVTVVFNSNCDELWWAEGGKGLVMVPKLADAFRKKHADWTKSAPRR